MGLILWIIFGALVGWIASLIVGTDREQGPILNIIVGIIGALLGGLIMNLFGSSGIITFSLRSFLVSLLGAVILLVIVRGISSGMNHSSQTHI